MIDVDHGGAQAGADHGICHQDGRYGLAGGPGRRPERAHQEPDRPSAVPREGLPLAARAAGDGRPASPPARLPQAQECRALPGAGQATWPAPLTPKPSPATSGPQGLFDGGLSTLSRSFAIRPARSSSLAGPTQGVAPPSFAWVRPVLIRPLPEG